MQPAARQPFDPRFARRGHFKLVLVTRADSTGVTRLRMNSESTHRPRLGNWQLVAKLLLPSWNFFNDFAEVTRLEFRWVTAAGAESRWQPLHPVNSTRCWWRLFFNPAGNLDLLEKSLIDRIATALTEPTPNGSFQAEEGGEILMRITRARLQVAETGPPGKHFCLRLVRLAPSGPPEILFCSTPQALGESAR